MQDPDTLVPIHEPCVLFGFLAACTGRLGLAATVALPQRQTAVVAKQAAEIDILTGARGRCPACRGGWSDRGRWSRALVRELGVTPVIGRRGTEHGSGLGKLRWVVEQSFALLHWFRRLRIRWEIRDDIHEALLKLGCALICWRRLHHSKS